MNGAASPDAALSVPNGRRMEETVGSGRPIKVEGNVPDWKNGRYEIAAEHAATNGVVENGYELSPSTGSSPRLDEMPLEVRQAIQGCFLPMAKVIGRSTQECWNGLLALVNELAQMPIPLQPHGPSSAASKPLTNGVPVNDQSKANLDKKERLLTFASNQKAIFIKLLVLLQWSKDASDVSKALQLNYWLHQQRGLYLQAAHELGQMKRRLASVQLPSPDLKTAAEVLSSRRVAAFPNLGYATEKPMATRQMLRTLRYLNTVLCARLTLANDIPLPFRRYWVHDGRVTFSVPDEFELDLWVVDEETTSPFYFLDFRFIFAPRTDLPDGALQHDIAVKINEILQIEGLSACYDFLHEMTLSYKISILHKQALDLGRGQWSSGMRVELIRRTLTVQYWSGRPAGKSWIEIGVQGGRRTKSELPHGDRPEPYLAVRWIREQKLVDDVEITLDPGHLSMDAILRQVLALHTNSILDAVYEKVGASPCYAHGALLLEQRYSLVEPSECRLQLQLTERRSLSVTVEPVSGCVVLSPASPLSIRIEHEISQAKSVVDELPLKIARLRCISAEQDLMDAAEGSTWDIVRTFKPTPAEVRQLFATTVVRMVSLRQSQWPAEVMIVAAYGPHGDSWWLLGPGSAPPTSSWTSQRIESSLMQGGGSVFRTALAELATYASGIIALQSNAAYLASADIPFLLPRIPPFEKGYRLPKISFDFDAETLRPLLWGSREGKEPDGGQPLSLLAPQTSQSHIERTIRISYHHWDHVSGRSVLVAHGRCSAPQKVLVDLAAAKLDSDISLHPTNGRFSVRLESPTGMPVLEQLVQRLLHFDNMVACLSVVQDHATMRVSSSSLTHLGVHYLKNADGELGFTLKFGAPSSLSFDLWPRRTNPHLPIADHLREILMDPRRSLSMNLKLILPLLSYTAPLLACLRKLQQPPTTELGGLPPEDLLSRPQVHVMPRHPTMYGIQYFTPPNAAPAMPANSEGSPRMLARLEVVPCQRGQQAFWILRPAIEEFESYTRPSFSAEDLHAKLKADIFTHTDPEGGWLPLDGGAACPVEEPERLIRAVHDLVVNWYTKKHEDASGDQMNVPSPTAKRAGNQPAPRAPARPPVPQRPPLNGANPPKGRPGVPAGKGIPKRNNEIITLD